MNIKEPNMFFKDIPMAIYFKNRYSPKFTLPKF